MKVLSDFQYVVGFEWIQQYNGILQVLYAHITTTTYGVWLQLKDWF